MFFAKEKIFFDKADHELLELIDSIANRDKTQKHLKKLFDPYLHPRGIKEMAASREVRIAYAVMNLIDSLRGKARQERINALRSLRDEILKSGQASLRRNTARILLQIMKRLVRNRDNRDLQLELAHDFHTAILGRPRFIREQLRKYFLLEMPEEWNQLAFDDHVHDANTKGRKSPTHLIMDAWIKGMRSLQVVYYNYVPREAAEELLEAAEIMDIKVRIGVEFSTCFRNRFIQMIWTPRGFRDAKDFLEFLDEKVVGKLMAEGLKVSEYQEQQTLKALKNFNHKVLKKFCQDFNVKISSLEKSEFVDFVGKGQCSLIHLAEFLFSKLSFASSRKSKKSVDVDPEEILELYIKPNAPKFTPKSTADGPGLLKLTPNELVEKLRSCGAGFRLTLNLSGLDDKDVLELLFECEGHISLLEIFNLKDYSYGHINTKTNQLRIAINDGNVIKLKRKVMEMIDSNQKSKYSHKKDRDRNLTRILCQLSDLTSFYQDSPLGAKMGSDSTGRSKRLYGMGLAVIDTLPKRARKEIESETERTREILPVKTAVYPRLCMFPVSCRMKWIDSLARFTRSLPLLGPLGFEIKKEWVVEDNAADMSGDGNIATLGGAGDVDINSNLLPNTEEKAPRSFSVKHMNSNLKNVLKVLIGLLPAFLTFFLTKDWWVLAWFGAFIWFGITGFRNILQSVLGGGGLRRSDLLSWNDFVSWGRVSDSLFYTGLSVPLLDYLVKSLIMSGTFGVTASSNPYLLYTVMALANGIYISSHNIIRGLPKSAVVGNFFRSILSIPLAVIFNAGIGGILALSGVPGIASILQQWAAVISKTASDCIAGIIEGGADRFNNIKLRLEDYKNKIDQTFSAYAKLEMLFPEEDVLKLLESPKNIILALTTEEKNLEKILIVNALDLLYFWKYQPQAYNALYTVLSELTPEERQIFLRCQRVLERKKEISQMFLEGIVGKSFSKPLAFYLNQSKSYMSSMESLCAKIDSRSVSPL